MTTPRESWIIKAWMQRSLMGDMMACPPPVGVEMVEEAAMEANSDDEEADDD